MTIQSELSQALVSFQRAGFITDVIGDLKSGKEASVFLCRAHPSTGEELIAVKVYRPAESRSFRRDATYLGGRFPTKRDQQAILYKRNFKGNVLRWDHWIAWEEQILDRMHAGGLRVPRVLGRTEHGIAMELVEHEGEPAPTLQAACLPGDGTSNPARRALAHDLFVEALRGLETMLGLECVHSDLSEHNMLYADGHLVFIDFPQAVDPRFNNMGWELFARDVDNLCRYFATLGVRADPVTLAIEAWERYLRNEL